MNDAQFSELLKHIDGVSDVIIVGALTAAFIIFLAIMSHGWTRK
jgi:hypothetical protein